MRPTLSEIQRVCEKGVDLPWRTALDLAFEVQRLRGLVRLYRSIAKPAQDFLLAEQLAARDPSELVKLFVLDLQKGLYDEEDMAQLRVLRAEASP